MAQYRAITDIFGPAPECRYFQAGDMLTDIVPTPAGFLPIPSNWVPPLGVEPIDAAAQQAFFNAGPSGMTASDHGVPNTSMAGQRWSDRPVSAPAVYWKQAPGGGWTLGGKQWGNG
jgi:hypothetical protein